MPGFKKRSYKKRAATKKKSSRGGRKSSAVSSAVKTYVKQTIHSQIENKTQSQRESLSFGTANESPDLNVFPITPYIGGLTILQGTAQNQRIGNTIKTRKVMLNYVLRPVTYDALVTPTPQPIIVQLFLGRVKQYKGIAPTVTDMNFLFQLGNTSTAPTGTLLDLVYIINKDDWDIKKQWTHKLGNSIYNAANGLNGLNQYFANNDYKLNYVKKVDVTKYCPATIKFDDNSATNNGNGLFFFFQAIKANGDTGNSTNLLAHIDYFITYEYEDA